MDTGIGLDLDQELDQDLNVDPSLDLNLDSDIDLRVDLDFKSESPMDLDLDPENGPELGVVQGFRPDLGQYSNIIPQWFRTAKNRDLCTRPLGSLFAYLLAPLTHSLASPCLPTNSLTPSLTPKLIRCL